MKDFCTALYFVKVGRKIMIQTLNTEYIYEIHKLYCYFNYSHLNRLHPNITNNSENKQHVIVKL